MANVIVVGSQWGDEGKGKFVDWLSERADVVVRYQGGHNAGHTLVIDGVSYKIALVPSGVVRGKFSVIGNGVVFDPHFFLSEIEKLAGQGIKVTPEILRVADNAPLILSLHRDLDAMRENSNSGLKIGTTKRGIGPAYEDKVGRRAIRVCDLAEPDTLPAKVERLLAHHNALRRGMGLTELSVDPLVKELTDVRRQDPALCRPGLAAARRKAPRRRPHPVRGRAGRHARQRPRHLSVRHLVQHRRRAGGGRFRPRADGDRLCAGNHQGLHHSRGRRSVSLRTARRHRQAFVHNWPRGRGEHRAAAPLRLVRRRPGAADGADFGASPASP